MLKLEAAAAPPFLQHALVAAAKAEPEGRRTQAMAESRAAVAANFATAQAIAENVFSSDSTAALTVAASERAWNRERLDPSLEEGEGAAAQRVDDGFDEDEIDAIKPLLRLLF